MLESRQSDRAYDAVKRLGQICRDASTAEEAERIALAEHPDLDLNLLRSLASYHYKFVLKKRSNHVR